MWMSRKIAFFVAVCAVTSLCGSASAEPAAPSNSMRAAGWVVIGVGTSLGLGTAATGVTLMANYPTEAEKQVGTASLVGGLATAVVALAIGIPLLYSGSAEGPRATARERVTGSSPSGEAIARALAGEIRF